MLYRQVCPTAVREVHGLDRLVECVKKTGAMKKGRGVP